MRRRSRGAFYAVHRGRRVGVFRSWAEVQPLVSGYPGARFARFDAYARARTYAATGDAVGGDRPLAWVAGLPVISALHPGEGVLPLSRAASYLSSPVKSVAGGKDGRPADAAAASSYHGDREEGERAGRGYARADASDAPPRSASDGGPDARDRVNSCGRSTGRTGAYAIWFGDGDPRNESGPVPPGVDGRCDSGRAALYAMLRACEAVAASSASGMPPPGAARVYTDSVYAVKAARDHLPAWERNGFRTARGGTALNRDLLARIGEWLRAHPGSVTFACAQQGRAEGGGFLRASEAADGALASLG